MHLRWNLQTAPGLVVGSKSVERLVAYSANKFIFKLLALQLVRKSWSCTSRNAQTSNAKVRRRLQPNTAIGLDRTVGSVDRNRTRAGRASMLDDRYNRSLSSLRAAGHEPFVPTMRKARAYFQNSRVPTATTYPGGGRQTYTQQRE